ncbi:MAG: formate dehydrogenase accessory sulfurtransferase FdhD, partial [Calditrichaeota bacterium]|nr:formate dehydrogenase accessory sulfurtransferase FdhD [Calditrichota bacterium]
MKTISSLQAVKYQNGKPENVEDALTVEEVLQININYVPYSITMRTPGADRELIRGLLFTEEIFTERASSFTDLMEAKRNSEGIAQAINVLVEPDLIKKDFSKDRSTLTVASCGLCGKRKLDDEHSCGEPLRSNAKLRIEAVRLLFDQMNEKQRTFKQSGGSHASAAFDANNNLLAIYEDIGRHNAVDKVIGSLLENGNLESAETILVSGRISYEIVNKAYRAGIP